MAFGFPLLVMGRAHANPGAAPPSEAPPPKPPKAVAPPKQELPQTVTAAEIPSLKRELEKAQKSALLALEHRQKLELDELAFSQKVRQQEWEADEREKKHKYFATTTDPAQRKSYMEQLKQRREAFEQSLKDELAMRTKEFAERRQFMEQGHAQNRGLFEQYLSEGKRPPEHLWPPRGQ